MEEKYPRITISTTLSVGLACHLICSGAAGETQGLQSEVGVAVVATHTYNAL